MLPPVEAYKAAEREIEAIESHVAADRAGNDSLRSREIAATWHYIVYGAHIDPECGENYVSVDEPLTANRRRMISRRNRKTQALVQWLISLLSQGVSLAGVKDELARKQEFQTVRLATSRDELKSILVEALSRGYLLPGCIEGGYFDLIGSSAILYGWEEGIPCAGGVTDRYGVADNDT